MTYDLEFITPAFLCGANQNKAELRSPSLRGELRWWFRVLGADAAEERDLFGGLGEPPVASRIVVRVKNMQAKHEELPHFAPMSDLGYLYFFATVSGNKDGVHRTKSEAYFAPGTRFTVELLERRPLPDRSRECFNLAVEAAFRLGTLGLRATRGCGAIAEHGMEMTRAEFATWVRSLPATLTVGLAKDTVFSSWKDCQAELGLFLRTFRKDNHKSGKEESALGFSSGKMRESSALRLRPVKVKEGFLPVLIYTDGACSQTSILPAFRSALQPLI